MLQYSAVNISNITSVLETELSLSKEKKLLPQSRSIRTAAGKIKEYFLKWNVKILRQIQIQDNCIPQETV
jgi:hypothetical protein